MENKKEFDFEDYSKDPLLSGLGKLSEEKFEEVIENLEEKKRKSVGKEDENLENEDGKK